MQTQTTKHHFKLFLLLELLCFFSIYGLFIALRWLPLLPTAMAIAIITTIGLIIAGYLIYLSYHLHLITFRQIKAYANHQSTPTGTPSRIQKIMLPLLGAMIGLLIGGTITWWVATTILHWSL
ncbi:hypothetical protein [Lactiplantibacillus daowaiensis]|uniref:Uncharacterized protein n=1 Tax=Lactiplantibacillus daowaiensis TaxID=2559918 RepID=A0ABW1S102_9LACO|nr:hypothetical protein [Lactiplantibacillus daowaiensis]